MKLTVEISMYPLQDNYIPPIDGIIERLNSYPELKVKTTPTCTQLVGDYDRVMEILAIEIRQSYQMYGKAAYVTKFLPDYEPF